MKKSELEMVANNQPIVFSELKKIEGDNKSRHGSLMMIYPKTSEVITSTELSQTPQYAFPNGMKILQQTKRPGNQLLPMIIWPKDDQLFLQFLIFYESVNEILGKKEDGEQESIWIPKAIAIVSTNPYFEFFSQILVDLWFALFKDKEHEKYLAESLVRQLVDQ